MPNELRAPVVTLRQSIVEELFETARVTQIDRVPELRRSLVQIVYAVQVVVLGVPPEHRLPLADVDVRVRDARDVLICQALIQD